MRVFSLHNLHEWITDYMNGMLNPDELDKADAILLEHPHLLDEYLVELEQSVIEPDSSFIKDKSSLIVEIQPTANINQDNYTHYFVEAHEGELSTAQIKELETFLAINARLTNEFDIFSKVKLEAPQVFFPNKNKLIKKPAKSVPLYIWYGAAASVILFVGLWILIPGNEINTQQASQLTYKTQQINLTKLMPIISSDSQSNSYIPENASQQSNKNRESNENRAAINKRPEESLLGIVQNQSVRIVTGVESPADQHILTQVVMLPPNEQHDPYENVLLKNKTKKKSLFSKIISGEKTYIEDYVNATFKAFKNDSDEDKWVLKVDRDENGKSKRVKFSSPIFSIKSKQ